LTLFKGVSQTLPLDFLPWDKKKAKSLSLFDYLSMILAWQLPTLEEMPMPARFALFCLIPGPCCKTAGKSDDVVSA